MLDVKFGMNLVLTLDDRWIWPHQQFTAEEVDAALAFTEEQLENRLASIRSARAYIARLDFTEVTK
jgi:hypothetical protein